MQITSNKKVFQLFVILSGVLISSAILAELIGGKIFSVEKTLNIPLLNLSILGEQVNLNMTAGVLVWPVVFLFTDIINEYFGTRGVVLISWLTAFLVLFSFAVIFVAIKVFPSDFYTTSKQGSGINDMNIAFGAVFGQGMNIILGSLTAFILAQLVDSYIFKFIKNKLGHKYKWMRATASTIVSQFIDSFVVLFIAFYIGSRINNLPGDFIWPLSLVISLGLVNFVYKVLCAILLIPFLYGIHFLIKKYLGKDLHIQLESQGISLF